MLQGGQAVVGQPHWAELPSAADVDAAFAGTPKNVGTVHVVLNCTVEQGGGLGGCGVTSEEPSGVGFGKAALALAAKARVDTWTDQGLPVVGSEVRMPIRFETGAPDAAKP
jgi:protein TonB